MIIALMCMSLLGWSHWMMRRAARPTPVTTSDQHATPIVLATGLEDDPDQWRAARGAWTALDERQLIRLLTDSAT